MTREQARKAIISALWLTRERLTGDLEYKKIRRERLTDLKARMGTGAENPPAAADLREVLDESIPGIREAIAVWSPEEAPVTPQ